jgi:hypothetical protein
MASSIRTIEKYGTGELEIGVKSMADFESVLN